MRRKIFHFLTFAAFVLASAALRAETLWFRDGRPIEQASQVLDAMRSAETYGLVSEDYELQISREEIDSVLEGGADAKTRERFETALTKAASRFVRELHAGRIDPRAAGFDLPAPGAAFDVANAVRRLASSTDVAATLESFEPQPAPYRHLKTALAEYRRLAAQPALARLPALPVRSLRQGDEYAGAPQLRRLLTEIGDLAPTAAHEGDARIIDASLIEAVRRFQNRHGLTADGVIGPRTFAALTTPLSQRLSQVELSMERWRWIAPTGRPNIIVNIPQFMLFALPDEGRAGGIEMRVIVGETDPIARTPVFTSGITEVVFQPYWDVPRGILVRELLPRIRKDPSYLDRNDMEIVRGETDGARVMIPNDEAIEALAAGKLRLRQRPGPKNPLGPVKFVMRNRYNVYLHATPARALFERTQRTFSHGCIRVSEPRDLARYVLRNARDPWDDAAIDAALCRTGVLRVALAHPVRVTVFYATAVATQSEGVLFFDDVYGHDRRLRRLLDDRRKVSP
jgi:murein L,D-transpeptidase YcbB/YkuD